MIRYGAYTNLEGDMAKKEDKAFEEVIGIKYKRMIDSEVSRNYAKQLVDELDIASPDAAFLVGAIDAMIYDMAVALEFRDLQTWEYRKRLIEKLWRMETPAW
jgi:hypothetical protein